ncbi:hypothetical protein HY485_01210, partial [Candidatus Woesearchaeota archaeon]|nr:hypothetical protein [Candidatus Woesearchaeota archaeon]
MHKKSVKMLRKGQITIFIILALVLVLSIGTYTYITSRGELQHIEAQRPAIQQAPTEFTPVVEYVTNCLYNTAKTALIKIGESGGYLDTTKIKTNPFEPTEADGVEFSPGSELVIPYWWHLKDKNECEGNCNFENKMLPLNGRSSIETQIDDYINENLDLCLANFNAIEQQGYKINANKKPAARTTIAKDDVFVTLTYPLNIDKKGATHKIDTFYSALPVNFKEMYEVAEELTKLQAENNYLEKDIRELIDVFSRLDKEALPPVSDLRINFGVGTLWVKLNIEKQLKQILSSYIPLLQAAGTITHKYLKAPTSTEDKELYETLYNRGMIIPLEKDHPTIGVTYSYLDWWKPYVDISGCKGQLCQPESFGTTLGMLFGIQRYNFAYDISLPVLVEIKNPFAFNGEGYTLNFALEANMRNNKPMPAEFKPLRPVADVGVPTMFCDVDKRNGGVLNVTIIDGKTKKSVDEALIIYNCGTESCALGTTEKGLLKTMMPKCLGGVLSAEKYDYHPTFIPFDILSEDNRNTTITLEPYRYVDFSVKKYLLKKGIGWQLDINNPDPQAHDEQTLITLERKTMPLEEPFTAFGEIFGGKLSKEEDYSNNIRMLPGEYSVKLYTIKYPKPPIIIPKERRCFKGGILDEKKCYYVPEEDMVFDKKQPLPNGGAEYELTVTKEDLDDTKEIEWKVLNFALDKVLEVDRKIEDLDQLGKLQEYSELAKEQLKP